MRLNLFLLLTAGLLLGSCFVTTADEAKLKRVHIKDGHFYAGEERLRIWGFGAGAGMRLTDEQQTRCVERLEFLNVNCLRLIGLGATHYDAGVMHWEATNTRTIDPVRRAGWFRLQDKLREAGIYIAMCMEPGRTFKPDDVAVLETTPEDQRIWREHIAVMRRENRLQAGLLALIDERARAIRRELATGQLTMVNPSTGIPLAEDPQLALIETVNESHANVAIYRRKTHLDLPQYFQDKLYRRWRDYLRDKYGTTGKLREAWQPNGQEQAVVGLQTDESFEAQNMGLAPLLDEEGFSEARGQDVLNFCAWLDIDDQRDMVKLYRKLGYPGPSIHSAFWAGFDGPVDEYIQAVCPYTEDHNYWPSDLLYHQRLHLASAQGRRVDRPFWRSEARNSTGFGWGLSRTRIAYPLYHAVYFSLLDRDGVAFHAWHMYPGYDEHIYRFERPYESGHAYRLLFDIPWQVAFRAAGRLFESGEIRPLPPRYEEEPVLWKNSDVSTPHVYRSHKEGVLLVQTENFLAVANDQPAQYELSWGRFELTSDRLNVVIVERTTAHEYEITALGMAGDTVPKDGTLDYQPETWVTGNLTLTGESGTAHITHISDRNERLDTVTVSSNPVTIPLAEGVRLYRVKVEPDR